MKANGVTIRKKVVELSSILMVVSTQASGKEIFVMVEEN